MSASNEVVNKFAQRMISTMQEVKENGTRWQRPWILCKGERPNNPISGTKYRGFNRFLLQVMGDVMKYPTARFMTYKQAQQCGGQVAKGEKATPIVFFSDLKDRTTGEPLRNENGSKKFVLKKYSVFNVYQIDGLPAEWQTPPVMPEMEEPEKKDRAEGLLVASGAKHTFENNDRAFYRPMTDEIVFPMRRQFMESWGMYSVIFHELAHWTGAAHRLNRDLDHSGRATKGYAKEELIAELTAAMLCDDMGFEKAITNNAAYLNGWITLLSDDPRVIYTVLGSAEKAREFIFDQAKQNSSIRIDRSEFLEQHGMGIGT